MVKTIASTNRHHQFCPVPPPVHTTRFEDRGFKDQSSAPILPPSRAAAEPPSLLQVVPLSSIASGRKCRLQGSLLLSSVISAMMLSHYVSSCNQEWSIFPFPSSLIKNFPSALQKIQPPKKLQHPSRQPPIPTLIPLPLPLLTPKNPPLLLPQPLPLLPLLLLPSLPC